MGLTIRALSVLISLATLFAGMTGELYAETTMDSMLALVSRDQRIPHTYVPEDLVLPAVRAARGKEDAIQMRREAARALEALFEAALAEGITLYAVSGYRSYALQKTIFQRKADEAGEKQAMRTVAPAGASEHQLGLAMDVNGENTVELGLVRQFGETPEGIWVQENAHRFGFIVRYQQDTADITGYAWEPWHLRYIGEEAAAEVYALGITFEEYHALMALRQLDAWEEMGGELP